MKLRNKLIATIVSISMVLAVIGVGAWASTESFTATITNTVNLEFDNISGEILVQAMSGADNLEYADEPYLQETTMFDGSNVIYNQISSSATSGQNLYWAGTRFLDSSDEGLQVLSNETTAAVYGYVFTYKPTEACVGTSTITVMVNETNTPEISGGKLMIKYFASTDGQYWTELQSGVPVTPIADNEMLMIGAVCQYYNMNGESITTTASAWDFEVVFTSGSAEKISLTGQIVLNLSGGASGVLLPYDYQGEELNLWEIIEFGEYPQTLKANDVTITSDTPDADGYYPGSDGARYAKHTINLDEDYSEYSSLGMLTSKNGVRMAEDGTYYFKVEPIQWRVLKDENGQALIVADKILKAMAFQAIYTNDGDGWHTTGNGAPEGTFVNNYLYSDLRVYMNGDFYNKAFDAAEQAKILTTEVDNSAATTENPSNNPFVCANTNDKVFALSYADLINEEYQFNADPKVVDPARAWKTTDYAKATGAITFTAEFISMQAPSGQAPQMMPYIDTGIVWLRSPESQGLGGVERVVGGLIEDDDAMAIFYGCVPAMNIAR